MPQRPTALAACLTTLLLAPLADARNVIVISCDGMRPDAIATLGKEDAPNLHRLIEEGAYTGNARTDAAYSVTLPNHTSMVTGRGVKGEDGHNWTSNGTPKIGQTLHRNKKAYLRGMFGVAHDHGLRTALFASKTKFVAYDLSYNERSGCEDTVGEDNGKDKIDVFEFEADTDKLMEQYIAAIAEKPFQLSMVHLRDTDTAGHAKGWDLTPGSHYLGALAKIDGLIGQLLTAIDENPTLKGKTALIVTADHGGRLETKTHLKADHPLNYTIPFIVWAPGVAAGADLYALNPESRKDPGEANPGYDSPDPQPIRNGDAGNLALYLLGLPAMEGSTINAKQDLKVSAPK